MPQQYPTPDEIQACRIYGTNGLELCRKYGITSFELYDLEQYGRVRHSTEIWATELRERNGGKLAMWGQ